MNNRKILYFCPSKTASNTIIKILNNYKLLYFTKKQHEEITHAIPSHSISFCKNVQDFLDSYKIISIRNPYDRFISSFFYDCQDKNRNLPIEYKNLSNYLDYYKFRVYENKLSHYNVMYKYLYFNDDNSIIDYIIKFESLQKDLENIIKYFFNLDKIDNLELPKLMSSTHFHFTSYYTEKLAEKVYSFFRDDFSTFGYNKESWRE